MATMQDVADRAGVSIATVSFVVNETKKVSMKTRERVTAAMAELGYHRNVVARALASQQTHIVALLYPALDHRNGPATTAFVTQAALSARARGYDLVLWPLSSEPDQMARLIAGGLVDGVVLMDVRLHDARVDALVHSQTPFSLIGRTSDAGHPFVDIDFEITLEAAVDHLCTLGHKHIALVSERLPSEPLSDLGYLVRSEDAYRASMEARGLTPFVIGCAGTTQAGREGARRVFHDAPATTAVIVINENAAFGLLSGVVGEGYSVPRDVSMISLSTSFDVGGLTDPVLTTMKVPATELAALGVDSLIDQIEEHATAPQALIPCELVIAESTAQAHDRSQIS
ncbi:LacI family DNA-binding transcriptional regulator [Subtercola frigoramans]|uniref:DNA-binding LacI/PurR family transcriptional regulator n=1 Tax=Subtercola frigoramans TaxID=120298 RepID=A0ABS2L2F4_9MICO|nr:LacI family DNA-binding transcriptional regulator [Subtercola frigoramans]MBM7471204.1 DNA-binding LacI/PurR family transcriptional regulator [Subtercola frigoramans]